MDINNIKRIGYFENIGLYPILYCNNHGKIDLKTSSFKDNIQDDVLARLRINIVGESKDDTEHTLRYRAENGIKKIAGEKIGRYSIGYIEAMILKGRYNKVISEEKINIHKYTSKLNEAEVLENAVMLRSYIANLKKLGDTEPAIGIINRLYINDIFRKNGISKWFHNNIFEIIHQSSTIFVWGVILECGDFNNESKEKFGVDENEYKRFLVLHYGRCGYKNIGDIVKDKNNGVNPFILYKII